MSEEPYSTPEECNCWFCDKRIEQESPNNQEICDRMVCWDCGFEDEFVVKINALYAERCAELVKLRGRNAELCRAIEDELEAAKAAWANVGNHKASRHRKDVEFLTLLLKEN